METKASHATPRRLAAAVLHVVRAWALGTALLGAATAFYALLIEPSRIVVERATHELEPRSTAGREGALRIAFVSDFDMLEAPGRFERRVRERVNALEPDLIAVGGDFFGGDEVRVPDEALGAFRGWLEGFKAPHGVVVSWGEQEKAWAERIRAHFPPHVRDLDAGSEVLEAAGARVRVCGPEGVFPSFAVEPTGGGRAVAGWGRSVVAARYREPAAQRWTAIEVTARLLLGGPGDAPGLGVLETPGEPGYRLRVAPETFEWSLVRRPGGNGTGRLRDRSVFVAPRRPHEVRIRVEPGEHATVVRSRIWPAGEAEPEAWGIETADTSPRRGRAGTIALVAGGAWTGGRQVFEWVEVRDLAGALLLREEFDDAARFAANWENPGAPPDSYDATVVVAHNPVFLLDMPQLERPPLDLVLAGHTHGGQIRLWPFGPLHLDPELPRAWSSGFVRIEKMRGWLYVSRGVGTSKVPVRLFCPPEVTDMQLTLRRRPPH